MRRLCLALLVVGLVGCKSKITGNEGNFEFSYVADDDIRDFNKPIAVGARLDLSVKDVAAKKPVALSSAESDNESALKIASFEGGKVVLESVGDGEALISVQGTTQDGAELTDSVNMQGKTAEVLKLNHTCVGIGEDQARYLTGQTIVVPFELERENGQPTIGYGYYPVTFEPPEALTLTNLTASQYLYLKTGDTPQTVTLRSMIDATTLTVELVSPASIDGVVLAAGQIQETDVGDNNSYYVLPTIQGQRVCQANTTKNVESLTPETCTVKDRNAPLSNNDNEYGWLTVTGVAAGDCRVQVTYTEGNGGAGASGEVTIPIAP